MIWGKGIPVFWKKLPMPVANQHILSLEAFKKTSVFICLPFLPSLTNLSPCGVSALAYKACYSTAERSFFALHATWLHRWAFGALLLILHKNIGCMQFFEKQHQTFADSLLLRL
jgi:hypothetical protein